MPPLDTDVTAGTPSSPESTSFQDATPPSSSGSDASPPSSSGSDANSSVSSSENSSGESREDLLSVMKSAADQYGAPDDKTPEPKADPAQDPDTSADPNKPTDGASKDPAKSETERDPTDIPVDELAKYSPNAQSRIRDLVKANKDLRSKVEAAETVAPAAQGYQQLTNYMAQNQLGTEDVNLLLNVGSTLRRGDFKGFLSAVRPYVLAAEEALGARVADDLRSQVDDGLIDENAARELTRLRAERNQLQATVRHQQDTQAQEQVAAHAYAVQSTIADWEQRQVQADPDFALKVDTVRAFATALVRERGLPTSPQTAIVYADEALRRANAALGRVRPAPQPTRPTPSGAQAATGGVPEPKNLREAMQMGLDRARTSR